MCFEKWFIQNYWLSKYDNQREKILKLRGLKLIKITHSGKAEQSNAANFCFYLIKSFDPFVLETLDYIKDRIQSDFRRS